ncbi:pyridoxal-5-phosphate-dependent protein subunit beta [candidate division KSB3 bacterium]|uniref:Pyridoxal-5-phosphate-dependent protein subunit beta n=1 Tax=candidate division KSB3 bacterium TaxID=2044937 RepID=A0A2G6EAJ1_9BACT|nr:MAG: pyridoxal-5-phosphate-dependent protein subunit beta [candidate division KSB3 bacterium]PIE30725.1 MAG: pyridoxal-5-phosphate-dependent protein subunit beta [candidate division KSB3 bacterium]
MIELMTKVVNRSVVEKTAQHFKEKGIILPTFAQMRNPDLIPDKVKDKLRHIGLWDLNPLNLFRISWKNAAQESGGLYGGVNYLELPREITGVDARIVLLIGKWFPTGAHKVGAAYGCLAPRIITGEFDPTYHKAVWPSTGNYCRGGAFDSYLMDCTAVAILPEEMSQERFDWLKEIGAEVIATPGCESNVKEIYDKCWELRETREDVVIFNQFDEFGNPAWHYNITGYAIAEVYEHLKGDNSKLAAYVSATGSAGTIAAGDYLRTLVPQIKVVASEALQCPTLLMNGFGGHRIEGIGDKHVPWVHNVKNTDMVVAIDDEDCMRIFRLFNETQGHEYLRSSGISEELIENLPLLGISGVSNMLSAIKAAKYYEMTSDDIIFTLATDSAGMYQSRLSELSEERGPYSELQAAKDMEKCLYGSTVDYLKELSYQDRKSIHNLKYYTWIEQQAKEIDDLNQLWYDREIWPKLFNQAERWDELIQEFNDMSGVLEGL